MGKYLKKDNGKTLLLSSGILWAFSMLLFVGVICAEKLGAPHWYFVGGAITLASIANMLFLETSQGKAVSGQVFVISGAGLLFFACATYNYFHAPERVETSILVLYWLTLVFVSTLVAFIHWIDSKNGHFVSGVKTALKNNLGVIVILAVQVLLSVSTLGTLLKSDEAIYLMRISDWGGKFEALLSNLCLAGHYGHSVGFLYYIGITLFPLDGAGLRVINIVLTLLATWSVYKCIQRVFPGLDKREGLLATAVFAFSPMVLGLIHTVGLDQPQMCLFCIFVYAMVYDKRFLLPFLAIGLAFSKETGVVLLFGCAVGYTIFILVKALMTRRRPDNKSLFIIGMFACIGLFWLYAFRTQLFAYGVWSNVGSDSNAAEDGKHFINSVFISAKYITDKLKQLFVLNYAWLAWIVAGITVIIGRKQIKKTSLFKSPGGAMALGGMLAFLVFNCVFVTFTHYRYMVLGGLVICFAVCFAIELLNNKIVRKVILSCLGGIMLIQCFWQADPVTLASFRTVDTGNGKIVTTVSISAFVYEDATEEGLAKLALADGQVTNRTYLGLERVIEQAMDRIDYHEGVAFIFPDAFGIAFDQRIASRSIFGDNDYSIYHWEPNTGNVVTYETGIALRTAFVTPETDMSVFADCSEVYYMEIPFDYEGKGEFLSKYEILDFFEESFGIWKCKIYRIK